MKKYPQDIKDKIKEACEKHAWNIGVSHYRAKILYMAKDEKIDGYISSATMSVDHRYLEAELRIFPMFLNQYKIKGEGDSFLEEVISHEVGHIATWELYNVATCIYKTESETKDAWEKLTEMIGRMSVKIDELSKKNKSN